MRTWRGRRCSGHVRELARWRRRPVSPPSRRSSTPTTRRSSRPATCRRGSPRPAGAPASRTRPGRRPSCGPSWRASRSPTACAIRAAQRLSGRPVDVVHVVGGGARNDLLCQLTADACDLPVLAGPVEATAIGNVLVQARALGAVGDLPTCDGWSRRPSRYVGSPPPDERAWSRGRGARRARRLLTRPRSAERAADLATAVAASNSRNWWAVAAAAVRLSTSSLARMLETCTLAVLGEMNSSRRSHGCSSRRSAAGARAQGPPAPARDAHNRTPDGRDGQGRCERSPPRRANARASPPQPTDGRGLPSARRPVDGDNQFPPVAS